MPSVRLAFAVVSCSLAAGFLGASPARAAEPPNQHDPCAKAGRDLCGTTGVGYYRVYRYGVRWFGDYRRVVPGGAPGFCIDLRFWYPSAGHDYRKMSLASGL